MLKWQKLKTGDVGMQLGNFIEGSRICKIESGVSVCSDDVQGLFYVFEDGFVLVDPSYHQEAYDLLFLCLAHFIISVTLSIQINMQFDASKQVFALGIQEQGINRNQFYYKQQMHQQTQISINFEDIFSNHQIHNSIESAPQSPILSQSLINNTPYNQLSENHNQSIQSLRDNRSSNKPPFFHRHKLVHSASQQIMSIKKMMLNCFTVKIKKPSAEDIDRITKRLTESKGCKKIQCFNLHHSRKQQGKELIKPISKKTKNQLPKSKSSEAFQKVQPFNPNSVFERLHYNSKVRNFNRLNLKRDAQSRLDQGSPLSKKSKQSSASEKYLKNYVPFYKRLQGQLNRTFEKAELIKKHPKIVSELQNMTFQPKLYSSHYSKKIKSRYMDTAGKEYTDNDLIHLMNSSINTTSQAVNRSMQIMDRIQQHFFNKMRLIFVNEQTGQVKVSNQSVSLLSQIEFSILSNFIMYIQQNQIRADDFDYYLRSYFYYLPTPEKMQLRSHQTQSRFKYTQFDQLHKTHRKLSEINRKKCAKKNMNTSSIKSGQNTSRIGNNYHTTIQQYT